MNLVQRDLGLLKSMGNFWKQRFVILRVLNTKFDSGDIEIHFYGQCYGTSIYGTYKFGSINNSIKTNYRISDGMDLRRL